MSKFTKLTETLERVRRKNHGEYVFVSKAGKPIKSFRTAWDYALKKAGIKNLTFHSYRHIFGPRLGRAGRYKNDSRVNGTMRYKNDHALSAPYTGIKKEGC